MPVIGLNEQRAAKRASLPARVAACDGFDGIQYQLRFDTPAGEWTDVRLPVSEFVATFRGRKVPFAPSLDPAKVRAIGLMISDKQAGPFELLIDRVAIERRK